MHVLYHVKGLCGQRIRVDDIILIINGIKLEWIVTPACGFVFIMLCIIKTSYTFSVTAFNDFRYWGGIIDLEMRG